MPMKGFDRYELRIHGASASQAGMLLCYSGSAFIGRIDFYPDGVAIPQDYLWHPGGTSEYVVLHMPWSRFGDVVATVRVEKPLFLYINVTRGPGATTPGSGYLTTSASEREPVGEEEAAHA
jgi:hypothetical protein